MYFIPIERLLHKNLERCKVLGKGGFGDVYLSSYRDEESKTVIEVALKALKVERRVKASALGHLLEEFCLMVRHTHQNIVKTYGYTLQNDILLIVMDYCSKGSLHRHVLDHSMDDKEKIRLLLGVAKGLGYLHMRGILHLDVKPHNVLLDANLEPKLTDFGLSRRIQRGKVVEKTGFTLLYASPEQIQGLEVTEKSDVWSFGNLMYFVFTKKGPYDRLEVNIENVHSFATKNNLIDALVKLQRTPFFDDSESRRLEQILPKVTDLMYRCWSLDPKARPSMGKIVSTLQKTLAYIS